MKVEFSEQYTLYDFNAIVSAVGGSLGLFLGFSFFDFVKVLLKLAKRGHEKLAKREPDRKA